MRLPEPDKVVFCDISLEIAMENARKRASTKVDSGQDQVEVDAKYLKAGIELYRETAAKNPDWIWINCMRNVIDMKGEAEIQHEILEGLRRHKILPE